MRIPFLYKTELAFRHLFSNLKNIPAGIQLFLRIDKSNKISVPAKNYKNIKIKINGKNNKITIEDSNILYKAKINISIYGNNNEIHIHKGFSLSKNLNICIGMQHPNFEPGASGCSFVIGQNTSMEDVKYVTYNSNVKFETGEECLFASSINIYNTDAHPILSTETNKVLNPVSGIKIGRHCWIANYSTILKNTHIADETIVGWGSIVAGK